MAIYSVDTADILLHHLWPQCQYPVVSFARVKLVCAGVESRQGKALDFPEKAILAESKTLDAGVNMISGNTVTIRPVLASEIEQFVSLKNLSVLMDEYAIPIMESPQAILNEFYINGLVAEDFETYVLTDSNNRIIGSVHAFCPSIYRSAREIGVIIFDIQDRSRGYGKEAVRLFLSYLLAREGVNRVQMTIPINNSASRRIAERLGLQLEGIAKKMVYLKNGFHDCAIYATTK